jgi:hypothetical protein
MGVRFPLPAPTNYLIPLINSRGSAGWLRRLCLQPDQLHDSSVIRLRSVVASALRQPCRHGSRLHSARIRSGCSSRQSSKSTSLRFQRGEDCGRLCGEGHERSAPCTHAVARTLRAIAARQRKRVTVRTAELTDASFAATVPKPHGSFKQLRHSGRVKTASSCPFPSTHAVSKRWRASVIKTSLPSPFLVVPERVG